MPQYKETEEILKSLNLPIEYKDSYVKINDGNFQYQTYSYSQEGYTKFIGDITKYKEKIEKEAEEARRQLEELKRARELEILKKEAHQ